MACTAGRNSRFDRTLTVTEGSEVFTTTVSSSSELQAVLANRFGITVARERVEMVMARLVLPSADRAALERGTGVFFSVTRLRDSPDRPSRYNASANHSSATAGRAKGQWQTN